MKSQYSRYSIFHVQRCRRRKHRDAYTEKEGERERERETERGAKAICPFNFFKVGGIITM